MPEKINIMGIRFDNFGTDEAACFVVEKLSGNKNEYVCTPNPEMLLEAEKNIGFRNILNNSLLNIPDGIGILWAATNIKNERSKVKAILTLPLIILTPQRFKNVLKERVTGVDLIYSICEKLAGTEYSIFLLGAKEGVAKEAAKKLKNKYPGLKIAGTFAGSPDEKDREEIIKLINYKNPDILLVAYGAPKQEAWIAENLNRLRTVKIAIGVGGTFDFIAQQVKRAPKWMQKTGIEWLFRLIQQPSRIKRILNATVRFPYRFIKTL